MYWQSENFEEDFFFFFKYHMWMQVNLQLPSQLWSDWKGLKRSLLLHSSSLETGRIWVTIVSLDISSLCQSRRRKKTVVFSASFMHIPKSFRILQKCIIVDIFQITLCISLKSLFYSSLLHILISGKHHICTQQLWFLASLLTIRVKRVIRSWITDSLNKLHPLGEEKLKH